MQAFIARLKSRKLIQWLLAYLGAAWVLLQVLSQVGQNFGWPSSTLRILTVLLALGVLPVLVLAWYHGEKGQQRVSGPELLILASLLLIGGVLISLVGRRTPAAVPVADGGPTGGTVTAKPSPARQSIAVLPFADLSPGADQEYFSDGLTEELLNALARVDGLQVAARTSSFAFKGRNVPVRQVGRELGVAHVVEGSVRKAGNRLRITAQLIDVATGYHVWSETYDRELQDVFAVQEEIARSITDVLRLRLTDDAPLVKHYTKNPRAYDLYLRGRFYQSQDFGRDGERNVLRSIASFREALLHDSAYSLAYAGLADVYAENLADSYWAPAEAYPLAREAAERALALDSGLSEAHAALGAVRFWSDWDFGGAEREFRRAVELDPGNGRGWYYLSNLLSATLGRHAEGLAAARRAEQLDSIQWRALSLGIRVAAGDADVVLDSLAAVVRVHPDDERTLGLLCGMAYTAGRYAPALQCHRQYEARVGRPHKRSHNTSSGEAVMLAATGRRAEAEVILRELVTASGQDYVPPDYIAAIYAHLGDKDRAFQWLDRAYRGRSAWLVYLNTNRVWDPLRADPRFRTLLGKVGLSTPSEAGGG